MYSYEIDIFLRSRNWFIDKDEYMYVSDINNNPQIIQITYNSFQDNYYIKTNDGWSWIFKLKG